MQTAADLDVSGFQVAPDLIGEDAEDTNLLRKMAREAEAYLTSHRWAPPIDQLLLGYGLGGVVALFLLSSRLRFLEVKMTVYGWWSVIFHLRTS